MLGGGTFKVQNKVLPGAYINFISVQNANSNMGQRGIAAIAIESDWGDNKIIEVTSKDFISRANQLFGYDYSHEKLKGLRDLFKNATKVCIYRLNANGEKASNNYATAKYGGVRGNDIKIVIEENIDNTNKFDIKTLIDTTEVDKQTVTTSAELKDNDYVVFKKDTTLAVTAATPLSGGTNEIVTGQSHQDFLEKLEIYSFNVLGCLSKEKEVQDLYIAYTKRLRDEQGIKFQTVVYNNAANYEGVINLKNKTVEDDAALVYWITGVMANCEINSSNSNKRYDGEYEVNAEYTQKELEECINMGELVLHKVGNEIRILTDINSLTEITNIKGEEFKSNQTIRVLDQVATDIANIFNTKYLGKIQNNDSGRISLWNDIVSLFKEYQMIQAIENFNSKDIEIEQGNDKKSVVVNSKIQVLNAMEKLYMSIVVQ